MSDIKTINAERFKATAFFSLTLRRRFGNRARIRDGSKLAEYIALKAQARQEADDSAMFASPVQMDGKCSATIELISSEPLNQIVEFMNGVKDKLVGPIRGMANPSMIKEGLYSASIDLVQQFEDILNNGNLMLESSYVPAFLEDYPDAIERAKTLPVTQGGLGPLFNASIYPTKTSLKDAFKFEWQWLALSVPEGLPEGLREAAQAKLEKQLTDAADEISQALRESFSSLIAHAADRLSPAENGKAKIFRETTIKNIEDFISTFSSRNVMNDVELQLLVEKAKSVLRENGGVTPERLRKYAKVRQDVGQQFKEIQKSIDSMIVEKAGRKFNFDV